MMPAFATLKEFAGILKCSPRMVRKHRAAGRLVEDSGRIVVHASLERIAALKDPTRGGPRLRFAATQRPSGLEVDGDPLPSPGSREALFNAMSHVAADAWRLMASDGAAEPWRDPAALRVALDCAARRRVVQWLGGAVVAFVDEGDGGPLDELSMRIPEHLWWCSLPATGIQPGPDLPSEPQLASALAATLARASDWMQEAADGA